MQGIKFLDMVMDWFVELDMKKDLMDKELTEWLMLLLSLVNLTGENTSHHLTPFIYGKQDIIKNYKETIKRQVCI